MVSSLFGQCKVKKIFRVHNNPVWNWSHCRIVFVRNAIRLLSKKVWKKYWKTLECWSKHRIVNDFAKTCSFKVLDFDVFNDRHSRYILLFTKKLRRLLHFFIKRGIFPRRHSKHSQLKWRDGFLQQRSSTDWLLDKLQHRSGIMFCRICTIAHGIRVIWGKRGFIKRRIYRNSNFEHSSFLQNAFYHFAGFRCFCFGIVCFKALY